MLPVTPSLAAYPPASPSGASPATPPAASAGDSIPFVDPALPAPEAPIHWLTDPGTSMLHAVARRPPSATLADLGLADQPCIRHVVIGPDRVECLLIRTSRQSLTLRLTGHRASRAPVCLTFHIPARSKVKEAAAGLASFPDLLRGKPRWIKRNRSQVLSRDALVAVDGRERGALAAKLPRDAADQVPKSLALVRSGVIGSDWHGALRAIVMPIVMPQLSYASFAMQRLSTISFETNAMGCYALAPRRGAA